MTKYVPAEYMSRADIHMVILEKRKRDEKEEKGERNP